MRDDDVENVQEIQEAHAKQAKYGIINRSVSKNQRGKNTPKENYSIYYHLFENNINAVLLTSPDGGILAANPAACKLFGRTEDEIKQIGRNGIIDINDPRLPKAIEKLKCTGKFHSELTFIRKDGTKFPGELTSSVFNDKDGNVRTCMAIQDISERKKAEQALLYEKNFAESLIETAQAIVLVLDTDGRIVRINKYMGDISGYTLKEVQGKDWFTTFLPECDQKKIRKVFKNAVNDIQTHGKINPILTKTGEQLQIEWYDKTLKDNNGKIIGVLSIGLDITERKKAEQEMVSLKNFYGQVLNNVHDGIWVTDQNDCMIYINPGMEKISGVSSENVLGLNVTKDFPPETTSQFLKFYRKAKETFEPQEYEADVVTPAGRKTVQSGWLTPRTKEGKYDGMICTIQDITEQKKAQDELLTSQVKLSDALKIAKLGYWEYDFKDEMFTFNDQFYSVYRTSAEEVGGYKISPERYAQLFLYPEDACEFYDRMQEQNNGINVPESSQIKHRVRFGDGKSGYISVNFFVSKKDDKGRAVQTLGANQDITEQEKAEEAIKASEARYKALFDKSIEGIGLSKGNKVLSANKALLNIFGYDSLEEFLSIPLLDHVSPESKVKVRDIMDKRNKGLLGLDFSFGYKIIRRDGQIKDLEISGTRIQLDDEYYTLSTFRDITERKKMEQKLRESLNLNKMIIKTSPIGIWMYDESGQTIIFNPAAEAMSGGTYSELIKLNFKELESWKKTGLYDAAIEAIKSGKTIKKEVHATNTLGKEVWYEGFFTPVEFEGKKHLLFMAYDIKTQKYAEKYLQESQEKYQGMIKNLLEGFYEASLDGKLLEYNLEFIRILGLDPKKNYKEVKLLDFWQNPEDRKVYINELMEKGYVTNYLINARKPSGEKIIIRANSRLIKNENSDLSRIEGLFLDITEQKRMENALKENEEKLNIILDTVPAMIWLKDTEGRYIWSNRFHAESIGIQENMAAGKTDFDIFPKEQAEKFQKDDNEIVSTLKPKLAIIESYQNPNGKIGWVRTSKLPFFNKSDKIIGTIGFALDITEQKLAQDALSADEQLLNEVGRIAKIGGWEMDLITRKAKWTKGTYDIVEIVEGEPIPGPDEHLDYYLPDFRPIVEKAMNNLIEKDIHLDFEAQARTAKGNIKWFKAMGRAVREDNVCKKVFGTLQDITDLKRAEDVLNNQRRMLEEQMYLSRTLLDAMPCVAMLLRPQTREIVASNKAAVEVGAIPGKTCYETWAKRSEPCPWCRAPKLWKTDQEQHYEVEYKSITWDAYWIPVSKNLYMHFAFDITERKKIEANILKYQEQLKSLASQLTLTEEKERYRIATSLHDQIGQYLAVSRIKLVELLNSDISEEIHNTLALVDEWMYHAIQETRSLTFDLSSPILHELGIEKAILSWLDDEVRKKYKIETKFYTDKLPRTLDDDIQVLLFRSVRELLFNIIKHAHAGKVMVSIKTIDNNIQIVVEDDGIGFDVSEMNSGAARKHKFGLFSVRERLEYFGGNMKIDSAPSKGCRITLIAPLRKV